jgi:hypothetical protein
VNPAATPVRRLDLDWIRVSAFGLLILYHVGLVYAPYDWHIHSRHTFEWMREGVLVTNPWRLTLLFLVSGAALRFMTARRSAGQVARARAERLIPPLLLGTLILVPMLLSWFVPYLALSFNQPMGLSLELVNDFVLIPVLAGAILATLIGLRSALRAIP